MARDADYASITQDFDPAVELGSPCVIEANSDGLFAPSLSDPSLRVPCSCSGPSFEEEEIMNRLGARRVPLATVRRWLQALLSQDPGVDRDLHDVGKIAKGPINRRALAFYLWEHNDGTSQDRRLIVAGLRNVAADVLNAIETCDILNAQED